MTLEPQLDTLSKLMQKYSTKSSYIPLTQLPLLSLPWYFLKTEIRIGTLLLIVLRLNLDFTSFPINALILFQDPIQNPQWFHHHVSLGFSGLWLFLSLFFAFHDLDYFEECWSDVCTMSLSFDLFSGTEVTSIDFDSVDLGCPGI